MRNATHLRGRRARVARRSALGFDRFEIRVVPAVTASFSGSTLTLTGDSGGQNLEIGLDAANAIRVFDGGTAVSISGGTPTSSNTTLINVTLGNGQNAFRATAGFLNSGMLHGNIPATIGISLTSGSGNDTIVGGDGPDTITSGNGTDSISGEGGDDSLDGGNQSDTLSGGAGDDTVSGGVGNAADVITGDAGEDVLSGGNGDDTISGGDDDDLISGDGGTDALFGDNGQDTLNADDADLGNLAGSALPTNVNGGAGFRDRLVFADATNHTLVVANDAALRGFESFLGNSGVENLNLIAVTIPVTLNGGAGNDKLYGGTGDDDIIGGAGSDVCDGGAGNDSLTGSNGLVADGVANNLYGGAGNDIFNLFDNDVVFGANTETTTRNDADDSQDRVIARGAVNITFNMGASQIDAFDGVGTGNYNVTANTKAAAAGPVRIYTSDGNDVLTGTDLDDTIYSYSGSDSITANGGNDTVDGGSGSDSIAGNGGNDLLIGGAGVDTLLGGDGNDILRVDANGESVDGGAGFDRLLVDTTSGISINLGSSFIEQFDGNAGNDTVDGNGSTVALLIYGGGGDDSLIGGPGNDTIYGNAGADILFGQGGNDLLIGGTVAEADNDTLDGFTGNDTLEGGGGNDSFNAGAGNDVVRLASPTAVVTSSSLSTAVDYLTDLDMIVVDQPIDLTLTLEAGYLDVFRGNSGRESITVTTTGTSEMPVTLFGDGGDDTLTSGAGNDYVDGGAGDDWITTNGGHDIAFGGIGEDSIDGGDGNDNFDGGFGADTLVGGNGNDTLFGGNDSDPDSLTGGAGADLFLFVTSVVAPDVIVDYTPGAPDFDKRKALDTNTEF